MYMFAASLLALLPLASAGPTVRPRQTACSDASFNGFAWTVTGFDYHASKIFTTPAHQNSWGYVNFNLTNPAVPYTVTCSAESNQLSEFFYGTFAYNCTKPADAPAGAGPTTFTFARPSNQLQFNQTWQCTDPNYPQWPTTFKGYGTANLTLDCKDSQWLNSNWTQGQIYSDTKTTCAPTTLSVTPYQLEAAA